MSALIPTLLASSLARAETVIEYTDYEKPPRAPWNLIAGGVGGRADLLQGELGFSMVSAAYHHSLSDTVTIGGMLGFDYAYWAPDEAFGAAFLLAAPVRISLHETRDYGFTLRMVPGLYLGFDQEYSDEFIPGLWLEAGVSGGYRIHPNVLIGGGLDVPLVLGFPTGRRDVFVAAPILIGPMTEWHIDRSWAFTAELKMGPHVMTDDFYGTRFGVRFLLGLAYQL